MKLNLLTLTILFNIFFLVYGKSSKYVKLLDKNVFRTRRQSSSTISTEVDVSNNTKEDNIVPSTEPDNNVETTAAFDPGFSTELVTTEATFATTSHIDPDVRDCPKNQSSFSKDDLYAIVSYFSDVKFNILPNISDAYHDIAIRARDDLLHEFNEFKTRFEKRPAHLIHVLDDMADTRDKKIVPLVKIASVTLQELPVAEDNFNILFNKTTKMLDELEKYKKICELNNCTPQLRSGFPSQESGFTLVKQEDPEYMCTTIANVHTTVQERLYAYELEEIKRVTKYVTDFDDVLTKSIANLKLRLREAAVSQFGITMYEILTLYDDHFHFMKSLIDFNVKSYASALRKNIMSIQYQLLDLNDQIQKYRQHCLTCGQVQNQRRFGTGVEITKVLTVKTATNILDQMINAKITEIGNVVQASIDGIFAELNNTVTDDKFIEKTIATLQPIQKTVINRSEVEKQALNTLMQSVQKESLKHAQDVYTKSEELLSSVKDALNFLA